jgi:DNA-binding NarL/FixJ family response regulator
MRVLIVDDNPQFLTILSQWLERDSRMKIVGRSSSGADCVDLVVAMRPDLVVMDLAMPGMNGLDATRLLKRQPNPPKVIVLSLYDSTMCRREAADAGADGFVSKADLGVKLIEEIRSVFSREGQKEAPQWTS